MGVVFGGVVGQTWLGLDEEKVSDAGGAGRWEG
jgi:hypothetical protein